MTSLLLVFFFFRSWFFSLGEPGQGYVEILFGDYDAATKKFKRKLKHTIFEDAYIIPQIVFFPDLKMSF